MASSLVPLARRLFSRSVTYARRSTGSHEHRIDGYSLLHQASRPGEAVTSKPFYVGGRRFELLLYPNGITADHRGSLSADLRLAYDDYNDCALPEHWHKATGRYRLSILDGAGNPVFSRAVGPCRFLTPACHWRFYDWREVEGEEIVKRKTSVDELVAVDELRRSAPLILGNDDCIRVRCDVCVVETTDKWWSHPWFMRLQRAIHVLEI